MTVRVIVAEPEAPGAVAKFTAHASVLLPHPFDTDRLEAGTSAVLLLTTRTVSGPVPVSVNATGDALPTPAVNDWLPPEPMVSVGAAGSVTVIVIDAGAPRLAPSSAETVTVTMPAGSALLYLGSLWHGGGANTTARSRIGVVLHYSAAWLRPVENHVLAVPRDVVRTLPARLQELLGYNVYPPFLGYVDGRHPRRVLD